MKENVLSNDTLDFISKTYSQIEKEGVQLYNGLERKNTSLSPSIIFRINYPDTLNIYRELQKHIPIKIRGNLLFQKPKTYHITIQKYEFESNTEFISQKIIEKIDQLVSRGMNKKMKIVFPLFSAHSIWGATDKVSESGLSKIRRDLKEEMNLLRVQSGIRHEIESLFYINLARFKKAFGFSIDEFLNLPSGTLEVNLSSIQFLLNDRLMSDKVKVIKEWKLQ